MPLLYVRYPKYLFWPIYYNILRMLILLMIAIQQKTSTLDGTIPFQIPAKMKMVSMKGFELNNPQRDLTKNLSVVLFFQTSLFSTSLSKCTFERITYIWSDRPMFLSRKGLVQEKNQNHLSPSHIPILSRLASVSLDKRKRIGNCSIKLPLSI